MDLLHLCSPYCCNCAGDNTGTSVRFCPCLLSPVFVDPHRIFHLLFIALLCLLTFWVLIRRLGWGSRYRDSPRDGQYWDRSTCGEKKVEVRFFVPVLTSPLDHLALCTIGAFFPGVKRPGCDAVFQPLLPPNLRIGWRYNYAPSTPAYASGMTFTFTLNKK
jgi:hypothetical protein